MRPSAYSYKRGRSASDAPPPRSEKSTAAEGSGSTDFFRSTFDKFFELNEAIIKTNRSWR